MPKKDTQFKEGNPGGPGREPKDHWLAWECKKLCPETLPQVKKAAKKGNLKAIEMIWHYAFGKPSEKKEHELSGGLSIKVCIE